MIRCEGYRCYSGKHRPSLKKYKTERGAGEGGRHIFKIETSKYIITNFVKDSEEKLQVVLR